VDPTTEEEIATIPAAGAKDVDHAVRVAREAFDNGPWPRLSYHERAKLIYALADLIEQNSTFLGDLESTNNGKPRSAASIDVSMTVDCLRYYAGYANKIHGKTYPVTGDVLCYTIQEPVGVCAQIIPWNFPIMMLAWKWGPCLASGSVSILKPSEKTPLTALAIAELARQAGFPRGVVQVLNGAGNVGELLVRHKDVDKVAFTGSTAVGKRILANSSATNLKRVTLELGGKSANIICHDADLEKGVETAIAGAYANNG
jgi:aldehyde dehydrogenase (NAD+)